MPRANQGHSTRWLQFTEAYALWMLAFVDLEKAPMELRQLPQPPVVRVRAIFYHCDLREALRPFFPHRQEQKLRRLADLQRAMLQWATTFEGEDVGVYSSIGEPERVNEDPTLLLFDHLRHPCPRWGPLRPPAGGAAIGAATPLAPAPIVDAADAAACASPGSTAPSPGGPAAPMPAAAPIDDSTPGAGVGAVDDPVSVGARSAIVPDALVPHGWVEQQTVAQLAGFVQEHMPLRVDSFLQLRLLCDPRLLDRADEFLDAEAIATPAARLEAERAQAARLVQRAQMIRSRSEGLEAADVPVSFKPFKDEVDFVRGIVFWPFTKLKAPLARAELLCQLMAARFYESKKLLLQRLAYDSFAMDDSFDEGTCAFEMCEAVLQIALIGDKLSPDMDVREADREQSAPKLINEDDENRRTLLHAWFSVFLKMVLKDGSWRPHAASSASRPPSALVCAGDDLLFLVLVVSLRPGVMAGFLAAIRELDERHRRDVRELVREWALQRHLLKQLQKTGERVMDEVASVTRLLRSAVDPTDVGVRLKYSLRPHMDEYLTGVQRTFKEGSPPSAPQIGCAILGLEQLLIELGDETLLCDVMREVFKVTNLLSGLTSAASSRPPPAGGDRQSVTAPSASTPRGDDTAGLDYIRALVQALFGKGELAFGSDSASVPLNDGLARSLPSIMVAMRENFWHPKMFIIVSFACARTAAADGEDRSLTASIWDLLVEGFFTPELVREFLVLDFYADAPTNLSFHRAFAEKCKQARVERSRSIDYYATATLLIDEAIFGGRMLAAMRQLDTLSIGRRGVQHEPPWKRDAAHRQEVLSIWLRTLLDMTCWNGMRSDPDVALRASDQRSAELQRCYMVVEWVCTAYPRPGIARGVEKAWEAWSPAQKRRLLQFYFRHHFLPLLEGSQRGEDVAPLAAAYSKYRQLLHAPSVDPNTRAGDPETHVPRWRQLFQGGAQAAQEEDAQAAARSSSHVHSSAVRTPDQEAMAVLGQVGFLVHLADPTLFAEVMQGITRTRRLFALATVDETPISLTSVLANTASTIIGGSTARGDSAEQSAATKQYRQAILSSMFGAAGFVQADEDATAEAFFHKGMQDLVISDLGPRLWHSKVLVLYTPSAFLQDPASKTLTRQAVRWLLCNGRGQEVAKHITDVWELALPPQKKTITMAEADELLQSILKALLELETRIAVVDVGDDAEDGLLAPQSSPLASLNESEQDLRFRIYADLLDKAEFYDKWVSGLSILVQSTRAELARAVIAAGRVLEFFKLSPLHKHHEKSLEWHTVFSKTSAELHKQSAGGLKPFEMAMGLIKEYLFGEDRVHDQPRVHRMKVTGLWVNSLLVMGIDHGDQLERRVHEVVEWVCVAYLRPGVADGMARAWSIFPQGNKLELLQSYFEHHYLPLLKKTTRRDDKELQQLAESYEVFKATDASASQWEELGQLATQATGAGDAPQRLRTARQEGMSILGLVSLLVQVDDLDLFAKVMREISTRSNLLQADYKASEDKQRNATAVTPGTQAVAATPSPASKLPKPPTPMPGIAEGDQGAVTPDVVDVTDAAADGEVGGEVGGEVEQAVSVTVSSMSKYLDVLLDTIFGIGELAQVGYGDADGKRTAPGLLHKGYRKEMPKIIAAIQPAARLWDRRTLVLYSPNAYAKDNPHARDTFRTLLYEGYGRMVAEECKRAFEMASGEKADLTPGDVNQMLKMVFAALLEVESTEAAPPAPSPIIIKPGAPLQSASQSAAPEEAPALAGPDSLKEAAERSQGRYWLFQTIILLAGRLGELAKSRNTKMIPLNDLSKVLDELAKKYKEYKENGGKAIPTAEERRADEEKKAAAFKREKQLSKKALLSAAAASAADGPPPLTQQTSAPTKLQRLPTSRPALMRRGSVQGSMKQLMMPAFRKKAPEQPTGLSALPEAEPVEENESEEDDDDGEDEYTKYDKWLKLQDDDVLDAPSTLAARRAGAHAQDEIDASTAPAPFDPQLCIEVFVEKHMKTDIERIVSTDAVAGELNQLLLNTFKLALRDSRFLTSFGKIADIVFSKVWTVDPNSREATEKRRVALHLLFPLTGVHHCMRARFWWPMLPALVRDSLMSLSHSRRHKRPRRRRRCLPSSSFRSSKKSSEKSSRRVTTSWRAAAFGTRIPTRCLAWAGATRSSTVSTKTRNSSSMRSSTSSFCACSSCASDSKSCTTTTPPSARRRARPLPKRLSSVSCRYAR